MFLMRSEYENLEKNFLAPYAFFSAEGERKYREKEDQTRTSFQRDCHRIYHSRSFRRMQGKRQVLPVKTNDHIRTRLTHTLEVTQIARSLARNHALNEDLVEAISLAHDIGHPPFGHVGEAALDEALSKYGKNFEHNEHSIRVVTEIENRSEDYPGLNLTFQTLEGLDKHKTYFFRNAKKQSGLEGQLANMADEIAYNSHDLEDAFSNQFIGLGEITGLSIWNFLKRDLPQNFIKKPLSRELARSLISLSVKDVSFELSKNIKQLNISSAGEVESMNSKIVGFSYGLKKAISELKVFLWEKYYHHPKLKREENEIQKTIFSLVDYYMKYPEKLPEDEKEKLKEKETAEIVRDYVAGMTDDFAKNVKKTLHKK